MVPAFPEMRHSRIIKSMKTQVSGGTVRCQVGGGMVRSQAKLDVGW